MSNRDLIFAGFLLCIIGAVAALFAGVLDIVNWATPPINLSNVNPLMYGIILLVLGVISIVFTLRARRVRRDVLPPILLLIFSLIIIYIEFGLTLGCLGGFLLLIGSILFLAARS